MTFTEAYVLVQSAADPGRLAAVLRDVPGVTVAEELRGPYDAIAFASTSEGRSLEHIVAAIRSLPDVDRALSAPLVASGAEDDRAA